MEELLRLINSLTPGDLAAMALALQAFQFDQQNAGPTFDILQALLHASYLPEKTQLLLLLLDQQDKAICGAILQDGKPIGTEVIMDYWQSALLLHAGFIKEETYIHMALLADLLHAYAVSIRLGVSSQWDQAAERLGHLANVEHYIEAASGKCVPLIRLKYMLCQEEASHIAPLESLLMEITTQEDSLTLREDKERLLERIQHFKLLYDDRIKSCCKAIEDAKQTLQIRIDKEKKLLEQASWWSKFAGQIGFFARKASQTLPTSLHISPSDDVAASAPIESELLDPQSHDQMRHS